MRHQVLYLAGASCQQCETANSAISGVFGMASGPDQRDAMNVLEARIADLEAETLDLRRRVTAMERVLRLSTLKLP